MSEGLPEGSLTRPAETSDDAPRDAIEPAALSESPPAAVPSPPPGGRLVRVLAKAPGLAWHLTLRVLVVLVALSILVVGPWRWVDPPASSFMLRQAWAARQAGGGPPYYQYRWVPLAEIPPEVQLAVLAAEDQRFPNHIGFDGVEIRHAIDTYRRGGPLRGASTITQQTAKNLFLWHQGSWYRKLAEAWLAAFIELLWPKERILEVYLNVAQFSPATYGVEATSERYFHRPVGELGLHEGALLAGVLPAPANYRLDQPSERLLRRAAWIEDQASRLGGVRYLERL